MHRIARLLAVLFALSFASTSFAQATRTWVSGVGDDANPCSRTAPCKTFAGAISKTATAGVINVLDPGGYGGVTITKSITLEAEGDVAGILVSGTNAIIINAPAGGQVVLRNMRVVGLNTGLSAVRMLSGSSLLIEDSTFEDFATAGVDVAPTAMSTQVTVRNCTFRDNGDEVTEANVLIRPTAPHSASVVLDDVRMQGGANGVLVNGTADLVVRNSVISAATFDGVRIVSTGVADGLIDNVMINDGSAAGLSADGGTARLRVANSSITGNATGVLVANGGSVISFGNNRLEGNIGGNVFSATTPLK